tara:strand:+ start:2391 stop:2627 length:237 start_codon:yes stop_codon:yes gene_type:complete
MMPNCTTKTFPDSHYCLEHLSEEHVPGRPKVLPEKAENTSHFTNDQLIEILKTTQNGYLRHLVSQKLTDRLNPKTSTG